MRSHGLFMRGSCGIHAGFLRVHAGFMRCFMRGSCGDSCRVHAGFMWDSCGIRAGFMQVSCGIHAVFLRGSCRIHAAFMRDLRVHAAFMRGSFRMDVEIQTEFRVVLGPSRAFLESSRSILWPPWAISRPSCDIWGYLGSMGSSHGMDALRGPLRGWSIACMHAGVALRRPYKCNCVSTL